MMMIVENTLGFDNTSNHTFGVVGEFKLKR